MDDKILEKINKLLAMAEGESTEEARATFLEKAQSLMIKHAVDEAMLRASGEKEMGTVNHRYWFKEDRQTMLIKAKRELLSQLAALHRCKVIMYGKNGREAMGLIGFDSDMDHVSMMFASIMLQLQTDMEAAVVVGSARSFRVSFAHGYVRRVAWRLMEAQRRSMAEETNKVPGSALVLRDQSQLVVDKFDQMFPRTVKMKMSDSSRNNQAGMRAGDAAGSRADLGGTRIGGACNALRP